MNQNKSDKMSIWNIILSILQDALTKLPRPLSTPRQKWLARYFIYMKKAVLHGREKGIPEHPPWKNLEDDPFFLHFFVKQKIHENQEIIKKEETSIPIFEDYLDHREKWGDILVYLSENVSNDPKAFQWTKNLLGEGQTKTSYRQVPWIISLENFPSEELELFFNKKNSLVNLSLQLSETITDLVLTMDHPILITGHEKSQPILLKILQTLVQRLLNTILSD